MDGISEWNWISGIYHPKEKKAASRYLFPTRIITRVIALPGRPSVSETCSISPRRNKLRPDQFTEPEPPCSLFMVKKISTTCPLENHLHTSCRDKTGAKHSYLTASCCPPRSS